MGIAMTTGTRRTHDFCWINLMTPAGEAARTFFAALFGWRYGEMPGVPGGALILVDGLTAGALMDLDRVHLPPGTPPSIGVMVRVDDADATVAKLGELGGHAEPVVDVLDNGRMALCTDPNGAVFGLWQPKQAGTIEADSHAHGAPSWFETVTRDSKRATVFYAKLFGWTVESQPQAGTEYALFKLGTTPIGGALTSTPAMGDLPAHWATYFAVNDAAESTRRGVELGATLCLPVQDIAGVGRFAVLSSPQGVVFNVLEYSR
jgi:predicted enzyme related to lactoylglutathione lyase